MLDIHITFKDLVDSRINFQLFVNRFLLICVTFVCVSGTLLAQNTNVEMGREDKGKPLPTTRINNDKFKKIINIKIMSQSVNLTYA
jgi:hypothetical protein